jgi:dienelactone hydrolase
VCVLTYTYAMFSTDTSVHALVKRMVSEYRLEYAAKVARDLVLRLGVNLSRVDVTGFSVGAHIAGRTCQYLQRKTGHTVRLLLGKYFIKIYENIQ